jgi:ATP-dependent protease HslVU (ClpYQ) peptidase subunit
MTTIAAIQKFYGWELAADGQTTSGDRPFASVDQPKIIKRADYTFACAGKGYACDVAAFHWIPPESRALETTQQTYQHIVKHVVPSLRETFEQHGVTFDGDESFQMLLAHQGLLVQIECDFTVLMEDSGLYAIGSGAAYALGAMAAGLDPLEAVRIASLFDIWTGSDVESCSAGGDL